MDAGAGLGLSGLPTGNISSGDIRDAVADLVSDTSSFRSSAGVLSGVLRWENNIFVVHSPVLANRLLGVPVALMFAFGRRDVGPSRAARALARIDRSVLVGGSAGRLALVCHLDVVCCCTLNPSRPTPPDACSVYSLLLSRRAGGTVRAADVVEGTLQLGGSSHLHPPDIRGPWQQVCFVWFYVGGRDLVFYSPNRSSV